MKQARPRNTTSAASRPKCDESLTSVVPAVNLGNEARTSTPLKVSFERMARRRFQQPTPFKRGNWWYLQYWRDEFVEGKHSRKKAWAKLGEASLGVREAQKLAAEVLRPMNQGLESIGSATNFRIYVECTYIPLEMPLLAKTTQERYKGVLDHYLLPTFGDLSLRQLTPFVLQTYFSGMAGCSLSHESQDKVRDVLASVLRTATEKYHLLVTSPMVGIQLPPSTRGKRHKPYVTPEQFDELVNAIPEPYATMVYVAVFTGLRISELIGLKWHDLGSDSIVIDERYCRGDWSAPKSSASDTTIAVDRCVIERLHGLKGLVVSVRAGKAVRKYNLVKSDGPDDLVFQSVKDGKPMRDNNILARFIKPAARKLGLGFVNWRALRTSRATWMIQAGANPKDVQGQMRHSRIQTTLDIYAQFVPESQRKANEQTRLMAEQRIAAARAAKNRPIGQFLN